MPPAIPSAPLLPASLLSSCLTALTTTLEQASFDVYRGEVPAAALDDMVPGGQALLPDPHGRPAGSDRQGFPDAPDSPATPLLSAVFHQRSEGYALTKKATLWAAETHEYLFVHALPLLAEASWLPLREAVLARGKSLVRPHAEHLNSYISVILVCGSWQDGAAQILAKERYVKSFWWGLQGWMRLRVVAVRADGTLVCNRAAQDSLLPLVRRALEKVPAFQESGVRTL